MGSEVSKGRHDCKRGASSFSMHDEEEVFEKIGIKEGSFVLDLGCGAGDYSFEALKRVGKNGKVFAVDGNVDAINYVSSKARENGFSNFEASCVNILNKFDFENEVFDVCFVFTVLHAIDFKNNGEKVLREVSRVLKKGGRLFTIDCKKEKTEFGPPVALRISDKELEEVALRCGLERVSYSDLGNNYMLEFRKV